MIIFAITIIFYAFMVAIALTSISEQRKRINELESQIKNLETRLLELELSRFDIWLNKN